MQKEGIKEEKKKEKIRRFERKIHYREKERKMDRSDVKERRKIKYKKKI